MGVICAREQVRAVEQAGGRVAVQARLPWGWETLFAGEAAERALDDGLEELRDIIAEVEGRLAELRAAEELPDDAPAVRRAYRALCGYGSAIGRTGGR